MADNSGHFDHSRNKNLNKKDPNISCMFNKNFANYFLACKLFFDLQIIFLSKACRLV